MGKSGPRNNAPGAARLVKEPIFGIHQTSISLDAGILFVELTTLRSATAIQHRDIEKDLDLLRPSFTRNQYIGLLKRFYGFHLPWELKVSAALETEFLTRHFNQQLAIRPDAGGRYFAGYGNRTGQTSSAFPELMARRPPAENKQMLTAAISTFELMGDGLGGRGND